MVRLRKKHLSENSDSDAKHYAEIVKLYEYLWVFMANLTNSKSPVNLEFSQQIQQTFIHKEVETLSKLALVKLIVD